MVQKLSTRMPSLDRRLKALKEIAAQNNIVLQREDASSSSSYEAQLNTRTQNQSETEEIREKEDDFGGLCDSFKGKEKYKDVADAAQAAFESAAYAASAARAAMELYRSQPHDHDHNDPSNSTSPQPQRNLFTGHDDDPLRATTSQLEHPREEKCDNNSAAEKLGNQEHIISSSDPAHEILNQKKSEEEEDEVKREEKKPPFCAAAAMDVIGTSAGSNMQKKMPFSVRTRHVRTY